MLSYNDALAHEQQEASCVVCHDLVSSDRIIWHEVRLIHTVLPEYTVVPICVDCADLFHDVGPKPIPHASPSYLASRLCERPPE